MSFRQNLSLRLGQLCSRLPEGLSGAIWRIVRTGKRQPVYRLRGTDLAGNEASMIVAGQDAGEYLPRRFFREVIEEELVARVSIFHLPDVLASLRHTADITVARTDRVAARALFSNDYLSLPEWIRSSGRVPADVRELESRSGSLHQDLRLVRKHGFAVLESHRDQDLSDFYRTMYQSHTVARHKSAVYMKSPDELKRLFHAGCLLWILEGDRRVAGVVVARKAPRLILGALGTLQGDTALMRRGVLSACYLRAFEYAQRHGLTTIDFGATRPAVNDSLLRYKKKWGAVLNTEAAGHSRLLLYWKNTTQGLAAFLDESPLIFRSGARLAALSSAASPLLNLSETPGLDEIQVVSPGAPLWARRPPMPQPRQAPAKRYADVAAAHG